MSVDQDIREKKSFELLDDFPWDSGATIIGGYAISGYGSLRYSDDLDILVPQRSNKLLLNWLLGKGYSISKQANPNPQNYDGNYHRLLNGEVTIDLLAGYVRDRDAKIDIPEDWISQNPSWKKITGFASVIKRSVPIVRLESLWALKLQAGRDQDITDLYSIHHLKFEKGEVIGLFKSVMKESLKVKLRKTSQKAKSTKIYGDARSKLALKDTDKIRKSWLEFSETVDDIASRSCT